MTTPLATPQMIHGEMAAFVKREDEQHRSPLPGYMTPSHNFDGRRGSLRSAQSYCESFGSSDYSVYSDHSIPVTPPPVTPKPEANALHQGAFMGLSCQQFQSMSSISSMSFSHEVRDFGEPLCGPMVGSPEGIRPFPYNDADASRMFEPLPTHSMGMSHMSSPQATWSGSATSGWAEPPRSTFGWREEATRATHYPMSGPEEVHMGWTAGSVVSPDGLSAPYAQNPFDSPPATGQAAGFVKDETFSDDGYGWPDERRPNVASSPRVVKKEQRNRSSLLLSARSFEARKLGFIIPKKSRRTTNNLEVVFDGGNGRRLATGARIITDRVTRRSWTQGGIANETHPCPYPSCAKRFKRPEHCKRHMKTHEKRPPVGHCEVAKCWKPFDRHDNCIAHYKTHVKVPGKKDGKNEKLEIEKLLSMVTNPKVIAMLEREYADMLPRDWNFKGGRPATCPRARL